MNREKKTSGESVKTQCGKFLQFDWLRAVVFQLSLKYLHVKITNIVGIVV